MIELGSPVSYLVTGLCIVLCIIGLSIDLWMYSKPKQKKNDNNKVAGTMVINTTDPKKDVIRFELDISIEEMIEMDKVIFVVEHESENES